jgi:hypothetical protein
VIFREIGVSPEFWRNACFSFRWSKIVSRKALTIRLTGFALLCKIELSKKRSALFESWLHAIAGYPAQDNVGLFIFYRQV